MCVVRKRGEAETAFKPRRLRAANVNPNIIVLVDGVVDAVLKVRLGE